MKGLFGGLCSSKSSNLNQVSLDKIGLLKSCVKGATLEGPRQTSGSFDRMALEDGIAQFVRIDMDLIYRRDFVPSNEAIELILGEKIVDPCRKVLANRESWFQEAAEAANEGLDNSLSGSLATNEDKSFAEEMCQNVVSQLESKSSISSFIDNIRAHILYKQLGRLTTGEQIYSAIESKLTLDGNQAMRLLANEVQNSCRQRLLNPFRQNLPAFMIAENIAKIIMTSSSYTPNKITDKTSFAEQFKRLITKPCEGLVEVLKNWPQVRRQSGSLDSAHAFWLISEGVCKSILSNPKEQIAQSYAEYKKM